MQDELVFVAPAAGSPAPNLVACAVNAEPLDMQNHRSSIRKLFESGPQSAPASGPVCFCGATRYRTLLEGSHDRLRSRSYRFAVARCVACGLARTLPVPDPRQYERGYFPSTHAGRFVGATADEWSDSIVRDLEERFGVGRLLDVGCHVGNLVAVAGARGFTADGIDVDPIATAEARRLGRSVRTGSIETLDGAYDFVVMNHVLEHILDLRAVLRSVTRLLVPGGRAYVLVPYYGGLMPRLMKERWVAWGPSQHVWHFTPTTLTRVVQESTQLRAVEVTTSGVIEPPSVRLKGRVKAGVARFSRVFGWGDQIEAFFEKPEEVEIGGG